jgi:hypothetical protein
LRVLMQSSVDDGNSQGCVSESKRSRLYRRRYLK